jgi:hypothetical protein
MVGGGMRGIVNAWKATNNATCSKKQFQSGSKSNEANVKKDEESSILGTPKGCSRPYDKGTSKQPTESICLGALSDSSPSGVPADIIILYLSVTHYQFSAARVRDHHHTSPHTTLGYWYQRTPTTQLLLLFRHLGVPK